MTGLPYKCPVCLISSYSSADLDARYCAACHDFERFPFDPDRPRTIAMVAQMRERGDTWGLWWFFLWRVYRRIRSMIPYTGRLSSLRYAAIIAFHKGVLDKPDGPGPLN